jgi:hypothetical protein
MGPTKAPGLDGFPALFYQTHWEFFKEEICNAIRRFLCGGDIPEGSCDSIIVLIPKVAKLKHLNNFALLAYATSTTRLRLRCWQIG